jgi:hypothetical protein
VAVRQAVEDAVGSVDRHATLGPHRTRHHEGEHGQGDADRHGDQPRGQAA